MKKTLLIKGLSCSNCSQKIEKESIKIKGIKKCEINLMGGKVELELEENSSMPNIIEELQKVINRIESGVKIQEEKEDEEIVEEKESFLKKYIDFRIPIAIILFLISYKLEGRPQIVTLVITYLLVGADVIIKSLKNITRGQLFDENFLMTIATFGAIVIGQYQEAVAVMVFYQVGELFQDRAIENSRRSIKKLLDVRPNFANLKTKNGLEKVNPKKVSIGDIIVVKPGEKVPLDGIIVKGNARVNTSALTGESVPRGLEEGDEVLSGFINETALIEVRATKEFKNSAISKILKLVEEANSKKAPTEKFITKFAKYYTPVVVLLALIIGLLVPLVIGGSIAEWGYRALIFLVISCPCALVVSIPLGFFGGIGASSKLGILVKGGNYLEALTNAKHLVLDKTGTLTKGVFNVQEVSPAGNISKEKLLEYTAIAESNSNHPIAKSIVSEWGKEIDASRIEKFEEKAGYGIKVKIDNNEVVVGNKKYMKKLGAEIKDKITGTTVFVMIDNVYAGKITINDEIKEGSIGLVKDIRSKGIEDITVLTGDNEEATKEVVDELGITSYYSNLLPEGKLEKLEEIMKNSDGKVIFVGDGINDAPVLARADIGIAMGGLGSDSAIEASDVVIMNDETNKISTVMGIAKKTKRIVTQNIVLALGTKLIVMILGVFGIASMWMAIFADVGVSVIAILNAIRILKVKSTI